MCVCMYVCMYIPPPKHSMHVLHALAHAYRGARLIERACITHKHTHTRIYIYICIHTHIHTHTHNQEKEDAFLHHWAIRSRSSLAQGASSPITAATASSTPQQPQSLLQHSASTQQSKGPAVPAKQPLAANTTNNSLIPSASVRSGGKSVGADSDSNKGDVGENGTKSTSDAHAKGSAGAGRGLRDGGTGLLLMCLSDVLWVSAQCGMLMDECAAIVTR